MISNADKIDWLKITLFFIYGEIRAQYILSTWNKDIELELADNILKYIAPAIEVCFGSTGDECPPFIPLKYSALQNKITEILKLKRETKK